MLGVEESTLVAVLGADRSGERLRTRPSRIVVRAPTGGSPRTRSGRVISASAGQLGDFLIELSQGDGTIPVTLSNFPRAP
jgi:hypothetical protein